MSYTLIKNGIKILNSGIEKGSVLLKNDLIYNCDFSGELPENCRIIDAEGLYISPGFIDIHLHGGGGYDFMDCNIHAFKEIYNTHLKSGTTTILPTAVTADFETLLKAMDVCKAAMKEIPGICGMHLEGPFLSPFQKGAHKENLLHSPECYEVDGLVQLGKGVLKRITAAPELNNMPYFVNEMQKAGVLLSVGHSDADAETSKWAFNNGFSLVTHFYNATSFVRKRGQKVFAGIQEAALLDEDTAIEIIADGHHTAKEAVQLAVKLKGTDKVALVSDALRPAGLNVKESYLGERKPENRVIIEDGVAKLPDRTSFAGSIATASVLLKKGVEHYGFSIADTVKMLTATPADILGLKNKGCLKNGNIADIALFDNNFDVKMVILSGNVIER